MCLQVLSVNGLYLFLLYFSLRVLVQKTKNNSPGQKRCRISFKYTKKPTKTKPKIYCIKKKQTDAKSFTVTYNPMISQVFKEFFSFLKEKLLIFIFRLNKDQKDFRTELNY